LDPRLGSEPPAREPRALREEVRPAHHGNEDRSLFVQLRDRRPITTVAVRFHRGKPSSGAIVELPGPGGAIT